MIRFGILGTARIARAFLGFPLDGAEIQAVASRDLHRANLFADEFHISRRYGSYDELVADSRIDAVYIPLPPHLHCEYALKAAQWGKHVLIEKPAALSADEMRRMIVACRDRNVLFMEGFMYRFMNIHRRAKEIVQAGTIGPIRYVDFNFGFHIAIRGRTGYRTVKEMGGGALYDLGIYGVDFLRYITEQEPVLVHTHTRRKNAQEIDEFTHAVYRAGDVIATLTCAFTADANYYVLSGEEGSITAPVAISGRSLPNVLRIHLLKGDRKYEEQFPPENPYKAETEYFAQCIERKQEPFLNGMNSLKNLELLDRLRESSTPI